MMSSTTSYNLAIPTETYKELKNIAAKEGTSIAELLRRATRLLLYVRSIKEEPDARLLVERGNGIQEIVVDLL